MRYILQESKSPIHYMPHDHDSFDVKIIYINDKPQKSIYCNHNEMGLDQLLSILNSQLESSLQRK